MSRGPLPSRMCLLSELPDIDAGEKVRFLGCVMSYSTATGYLELVHLQPPESQVTASVDIRLALELVNPELTRVGEWVNVLGYKTTRQQLGPAERHAGPADRTTVEVQALRVWSTGPLDLARYERQCAT